MRRLRATNTLAANSAIGASPVSLHQPRAMSFAAGSLTRIRRLGAYFGPLCGRFWLSRAELLVGRSDFPR